MSLVSQRTQMWRRFLLHALFAACAVIQEWFRSTLMHAWRSRSAEIVLNGMVRTVVRSMCPCRIRFRILTASCSYSSQGGDWRRHQPSARPTELRTVAALSHAQWALL